MAVLPREFHGIRDRGGSYRALLRDPAVPNYAIGIWSDVSLFGPDDCGVWPIGERYHGGGVSYKLSGVECWRNSFGAPGEMRSLRTTLPSLELRFSNLDSLSPDSYSFFVSGFAEGGWSHYYHAGIRFTASLTSGTDRISFTPRATYSGSISTLTIPGTDPSGTVSGSGTAYQFNFDGSTYMVGDLVVDRAFSIPLSMPLLTLTIPNYGSICPYENISEQTVTIYELTPPGKYPLKLGETTLVSFPKHTVPPRGIVRLGTPGLYYIVGPPIKWIDPETGREREWLPDYRYYLRSEYCQNLAVGFIDGHGEGQGFNPGFFALVSPPR